MDEKKAASRDNDKSEKNVTPKFDEISTFLSCCSVIWVIRTGGKKLLLLLLLLLWVRSGNDTREEHTEKPLGSAAKNKKAAFVCACAPARALNAIDDEATTTVVKKKPPPNELSE